MKELLNLIRYAMPDPPPEEEDEDDTDQANPIGK